MTADRIDINSIKREAKKFGRHNAVDYQGALDAVAREHGYVDWLDLRDAHRKQVADDLENAPPMNPNSHLAARRSA